jgi:hypothetical protein
MSTTEQQPEVRVRSPYDSHVDRLIERFSALTEQARALVFPKAQNEPDKSRWSRARRFLHRLSSPFPIEFDGSLVGFAVYFGWMFAFASWVACYLVFLSLALDTPPLPPGSQSDSGPVQQIVTGVLAAVAGIIFIPAAYWRWIEFFRDRRFSKWLRVLLTVAFGLALSFHHYLFDTVERTRYVSFVYAHVGLFIFVYALVLIPALTYAYMLALYAMLRGLRLTRTSLKYLASIHHPMPIKILRKLILEPIPSGQKAESVWRLIDLSDEELKAIRSWSEANREGTDKRLLPTAVVFGVLGIFADTQMFSNFIERTLVFLYKALTPHADLGWQSEKFLVAAGEFTGAVLILSPIGVFVNLILSLFANLAAQSIIIEACIVAEYAREQRSRTCSQKVEPERQGSSLWKWFVGLLLGQ